MLRRKKESTALFPHSLSFSLFLYNVCPTVCLPFAFCRRESLVSREIYARAACPSLSVCVCAYIYILAYSYILLPSCPSLFPRANVRRCFLVNPVCRARNRLRKATVRCFPRSSAGKMLRQVYGLGAGDEELYVRRTFPRCSINFSDNLKYLFH